MELTSRAAIDSSRIDLTGSYGSTRNHQIYPRLAAKNAAGGGSNRGKGVEEALNILKFVPKRSAGIVAKTLRTAMANAENTQSVDVDRLYVKQVKVDEGGMWKRFMPRAQGTGHQDPQTTQSCHDGRWMRSVRGVKG